MAPSLYQPISGLYNQFKTRLSYFCNYSLASLAIRFGVTCVATSLFEL